MRFLPLRAELDALYARLYGLTCNKLEYITTQFKSLRDEEIAEHGEDRTARCR